MHWSYEILHTTKTLQRNPFLSSTTSPLFFQKKTRHVSWTERKKTNSMQFVGARVTGMAMMIAVNLSPYLAVVGWCDPPRPCGTSFFSENLVEKNGHIFLMCSSLVVAEVLNKASDMFWPASQIFPRFTLYTPEDNISNPKMEVWQTIFLFDWMIFRFHVDFCHSCKPTEKNTQKFHETLLKKSHDFGCRSPANYTI